MWEFAAHDCLLGVVVGAMTDIATACSTPADHILDLANGDVVVHGGVSLISEDARETVAAHKGLVEAFEKRTIGELTTTFEAITVYSSQRSSAKDSRGNSC